MSNLKFYNDKLCPDLWDSHSRLDPEIAKSLLNLAYDFYKKTKLQAQVCDVFLMGSIANYNWNPDSDIDIHVMVDYTKFHMPHETAVKIAKMVGSQWNSEHNVVIKGHKVEMNLQNISELKPHVTGIYSLVHHKWIRTPKKENIHLDKKIIKAKYESMKKYVESAINCKNKDHMEKAKDYLEAYRQYGLDTCGEMSYENIVFKMLRSAGLVKKLKTSIVSTYDNAMSIDEINKKDIKARHPSIDAYDVHANGSYVLNKLTLDNLKALRDKAGRLVTALSKDSKKTEEKANWSKWALNQYRLYDDEINKRLKYINKPVGEGYGMGDPTKDPIATGRWRVKFGGKKTPLLEDVSDSMSSFDDAGEDIFDFLQKLSLDDPLFHDPDEAKKTIRQAISVLARDAKHVIKASFTKDDEAVVKIFKSNEYIIDNLFIIVKEWAKVARKNYPDKKEDVKRLLRDCLNLMGEVNLETTEIYHSIRDFGNIIDGINKTKQLLQILKKIIHSAEAIIDFKGQPVMENLKLNKK